MNTLSIRLRYRPLRLGWCLLKGDLEAFRRAARLSFTMWGGRYNPLIPVDTPELAGALVKLFRVDALVPMSQGAEVAAFVKSHNHLPWPMLSREFFVATMDGGKSAAIVDIRHPAIRTYEEFYKNNPDPQPGLDIYQWSDADPLADVFLCSYGAFPEPAETGLDYAGMLRTSILAAPLIVPDAGEIDAPHPGRDTVASFNRQRIERHYAVHNYWDHPGFYVGQADDFDDLVNFWNLRAADVPLQFFDQRYAARLRPKVDQWAATVRQSPRPTRSQRLALWHRHELTLEGEIRAFGEGPLTNCAVGAEVWNGMNVRAPVMYFGEGAALASIDQGDRPTISFALTGKPFANDPAAHAEIYVLSVDPGIGLFGNEQATLHTPFIPELNEFYGRNTHFIWNAARAEPGSLGIVESVGAEHLSLRALSTSDLVCRVFEAVGIETAPSRSGRVATTLIRQMGGLDGCRVFKIAGVRTLIENYRPIKTSTAGQRCNSSRARVLFARCRTINRFTFMHASGAASLKTGRCSRICSTRVCFGRASNSTAQAASLSSGVR